MKLNRLFLLFVVSLLIGHGSLLVNTTSDGSDEYTIAVLTHLNFNDTLDSIFLHTPGSSYSYSIENIESIELSGELSVTDIEMLTSFSLKQNYPNPFNPVTEIRFDLPQSSEVKLVVFNALGQIVSELIKNRQMTAGVHSIHFDGKELPSGIYFYRLETNRFTKTRKMVLLR